MQCGWLLYLWGFLPRWCFCCEADCIIYLYAKLNPRLGLTYLSFRIAKLAVFPTVSFIRQANFSISSFHPSVSFPDCLLIPLFCLSSCPLLDMQPVTVTSVAMTSLLVRKRSIVFSRPPQKIERWRLGKWWWWWGETQKQNGARWVGDSRRWKKQQEEEKNVKKKQGGDEVQMCGRGVKYVCDCKG